jgi:hypothetical protein
MGEGMAIGRQAYLVSIAPAAFRRLRGTLASDLPGEERNEEHDGNAGKHLVD